MNQKSLFDKGEVVEAYDGVPYVRGSDTSQAAAESMQGVTGALRKKIYDFIKDAREDGATCDEVELCLEMSHQTASARMKELKDQGFIKQKREDNPIGDWGVTRPTRSGRKAAVYVAAR